MLCTWQCREWKNTWWTKTWILPFLCLSAVQSLARVVVPWVTALLHTSMEHICLGQAVKIFSLPLQPTKTPKVQVLTRGFMMIRSWRQKRIMVSFLTLNEEKLQINNYANAGLWKSFLSMPPDIFITHKISLTHWWS